MSMRRLSIVCCVSLLIALALSPAAMAGPSWASVEIGIDVTPGANVTNVVNVWSYSDAYADYGPPWVSASDSGSGEVSSATANLLPWAYGHGETDVLHAYSKADVLPADGQWAYAWGDGYQEYTFTAVGPGKVTFDISLPFKMDLGTTLPGDWAQGSYYGTIQLRRATSNAWWDFSMGNWNSVSDGATFYEADTGDFTIASPFNFTASEGGVLRIDADSYAQAYAVVPVPAAVLLGFLGLSAAGVGLRKLS